MSLRKVLRDVILLLAVVGAASGCFRIPEEVSRELTPPDGERPNNFEPLNRPPSRSAS